MTSHPWKHRLDHARRSRTHILHGSVLFANKIRFQTEFTFCNYARGMVNRRSSVLMMHAPSSLPISYVYPLLLITYVFRDKSKAILFPLF